MNEASSLLSTKDWGWKMGHVAVLFSETGARELGVEMFSIGWQGIGD
jgi:hypothetical protein